MTSAITRESAPRRLREPGRVSGEATSKTRRHQQIANFKMPKRVHFVDDLPRNAMGKVQKNVLRDRYS